MSEQSGNNNVVELTSSWDNGTLGMSEEVDSNYNTQWGTNRSDEYWPEDLGWSGEEIVFNSFRYLGAAVVLIPILLLVLAGAYHVVVDTYHYLTTMSPEEKAAFRGLVADAILIGILLAAISIRI